MAKIVNKYFKTDPWKIIEDGFNSAHGRAAESVFSLANEYMGVRGYFEEGYSGDSLLGSYINGIFTKDKGKPFWCKGLAYGECFIVNSVDWLYTRITINGEQLDLAKSKFRNFKRVLDMKTGTVNREFIWETSDGKLLKVSFLRFTSMEISNLGCQRITFEPINFSGDVEVKSCLDFATIYESTKRSYLSCSRKQKSGNIVADLAIVDDSGQQVFSSFKLKLPSQVETKLIEDEKMIGLGFSLPLTKGNPVSIDKMVINYAEKKSGVNSDEVWKQGFSIAEKKLKLTLEDALEGQGKCWAKIWETLDIEIEGDIEDQQGIRFNLFNLYQTYNGSDNTLNIGAKGLTGEVGGGQTWWVNETHCLPFYLFTNPKAARNLIEYRYKHLPQAIERAKEVDCVGARYPMATLDGTESYIWWEHSLLEIHVSAAIPYAIWQYEHLYQDKDFLYNRGIEVLLQSSRYFASRGQWSNSTDEFGFYGVMGADELHMMVHNNCYTNIMAKKVFEYTLQVVDEMKEKAPSELNAVFAKVGIDNNEIDRWKMMAKKIRINIDPKTGIYEQHDDFFDLPHIDVKTIPDNQFPVERNWAYDRIFRYDMVRQPDVLLFLFFFSQEYSLETKRANYEYYEPRCTNESSLSPAICSIMAAELGKYEKTMEYMKYAIRLDIDDYNKNTSEGLHITSMAAAWMNIVYGFGGMRSDGENLVFKPSLPKKWTSYSFSILYRGTRLYIKISNGYVIIKTDSSVAIPVTVYDKEYMVNVTGIEIKLLTK